MKNTNRFTIKFIILGLGVFVAIACSKNTEPKNENKTEPKPVATVSNNTDSPPINKVKKSDASKSEIPVDAEKLDLVKATLLEFNNAIEQEDFTDFYNTTAQIWQKGTTPEELNGKFSDFIDKRINLSEINSLDAEFAKAPEIRKEKGIEILTLEGKYKTGPKNINFVLDYVAENRDWKLIGIRVSLK